MITFFLKSPCRSLISGVFFSPASIFHRGCFSPIGKPEQLFQIGFSRQFFTNQFHFPPLKLVTLNNFCIPPFLYVILYIQVGVQKGQSFVSFIFQVGPCVSLTSKKGDICYLFPPLIGHKCFICTLDHLHHTKLVRAAVVQNTRN